jgi:hypothetical protein
MQGLHAEPLLDVGMQHSDIAETYDPFRMFTESGKIKFVNDPEGSVSPSCANNRPDAVIIEHLLKIAPPLIVGTCKLMLAAEHITAEHDLYVMLFEKPDGRVHLFEGDTPGRRDNGDFIAFFQVGWCDHAPKLTKKRIAGRIS